jgi:hypothetical protein
MITTLAVLVVLTVAVLLVARYGADSRSTGDPTGRDPAWPDRPVREHTPRADVALVRAALARVAAHIRCWELLDRSLRPWEAPAPVRTRSSSA